MEEMKRNRRKSFTINFKLKVIKFVEQFGAKKATIKFGVSYSNISHWFGLKERFTFQTKKNIRRTLKHKSHVRNNNDEINLVEWFKSARENGMRISRHRILKKLSKLSSRRHKSISSNISFIENFCKRNCIVRRKLTRTSHNVSHINNIDPHKDCNDFIENFNNKVKTFKIYEDDIYNLDETALRIYSDGNYTLETKGKKQVEVKVLGDIKKCVTVLLTITKSGRILRPYIIFKGIIFK